MARHLGYSISQGPDGQVDEHDTFTCGHCQVIVEVARRARPEDMGGLCKICMKLVCVRCNAQGTCTPWEKQMEKMEARERLFRSAGL